MFHELNSRREFLKFMGASGASLSTLSLLSCTKNTTPSRTSLPFAPLKPNREDQLNLAQGFSYDLMIQWGEKINDRGELFGFNNDYLATVPMPLKNKNEAILWANHEYFNSLFINGLKRGESKNKKQILKEMKSVGGSLLKIKKGPKGWKVIPSDYNRRVDGTSKIPFVSSRPIAGSKYAIGTSANCAGGVTPWNTILTCEENYDYNYGEVDMINKKRTLVKESVQDSQWEKYFKYPPEHYGWVVEVNPYTGKAKKLTGIGRYAHECATVRQAADGRCVVYSGDDKNDGCLYKFIADKPNSLESGQLYVADTQKGRWIPLDYKKHKVLQKHYNDQTDVLVYARKAAIQIGGTPLDRPEDIEINPKDQAVFVSLSNNKPKGNYHGSILKLEEKDNNPFALEFRARVFLAGGQGTMFSCPDNLAFDRKGNLWLTCDISGGAMNKGTYKSFGNNGLYYIPMSGPEAGMVLQVASAPNDAELTGPCFAPDGRSLFLSVQHPGERSKSLNDLTSHWPKGGPSTPKPAVVEIKGPTMDKLLS